MTEMEENYSKAIALGKEVHGTYAIPPWVREFLNDNSIGSVEAQPKYSHNEQVENANRHFSLMMDIGYGLGKMQTMQTVLAGQTGIATTVFSMLTSCIKMLEADEAQKITKEILAIQKDVGTKEAPNMRYVNWAMSVLSPAVATLITGDIENYVKTVGSVFIALYVLGRYDVVAEDVPEAWDFEGLPDLLKGLGE